MTKTFKLFLLFTLIIISFFLGNTCSANGIVEVTISEFTITIIQVAASYDDGITWHTIYESGTGTEMNINSADTGTMVTSLPLATNLPNGTIDRVTVILADTASFTGYALSEETYYYHAQQTVSYTTLITQACSTSAAPPSGNKVTIINIPQDVRTAIFNTSINISEGQTTTIKLNISLANALDTNSLISDNYLYTSSLPFIGSIGT